LKIWIQTWIPTIFSDNVAVLTRGHEEENVANCDKSVAELIEINLMFAQLELSLGAGDGDATLRALDHIMEALKELRGAAPKTPGKGGEKPDGKTS
jgi:hypothetical protein